MIFGVEDKIIKEGYIYKRGKHIKKWQKQWATISKNCMYFYENRA